MDTDRSTGRCLPSVVEPADRVQRQQRSWQGRLSKLQTQCTQVISARVSKKTNSHFHYAMLTISTLLPTYLQSNLAFAAVHAVNTRTYKDSTFQSLRTKMHPVEVPITPTHKRHQSDSLAFKKTQAKPRASEHSHAPLHPWIPATDHSVFTVSGPVAVPKGGDLS